MKRAIATHAGFALLPLLVMMLGSVVVALSLLEVALEQRRSTSAWQQVLRSEAAATGGLRSAPLGHPALVGLGVGDTLTLVSRTLANGVGTAVVARRLGLEVYVLEGRGTDAGGRLQREIGRAVWRLDAGQRMAARVAVIEAGAAVHVDASSRIEVGFLRAPPPGWPGVACTSAASFLSGLWAAPLPPSVIRSPIPWTPSLGPLDITRLISLGTAVGPGPVHPLPRVQAGGCQIGRLDNWGSPSDPLGPCGDHFANRTTAGSLVVRGGEGQGLLVVGGDLTLEAGVWFSGIVVVGGALRVRAGGRLDGFALAGGGAHLVGGSRVVGSGCAAWRALRATTVGWGAQILPDGGWIEPY